MRWWLRNEWGGAHFHGGMLLFAGTPLYAASARFSNASEMAMVPSKSTKRCDTLGRPLPECATTAESTLSVASHNTKVRMMRPRVNDKEVGRLVNACPANLPSSSAWRMRGPTRSLADQRTAGGMRDEQTA